jgi:stringent starvation protein B
MNESMTSSKPYIVRAFYDWICDNQLTPYVVVDVSVYGVMVPMAYVNDGQIILNVSPSAVGAISLEGDEIQFSARFGGKLEHLTVPYGAVGAIYAKENGAGTQLPIEHPEEVEALQTQSKSELKSVETKKDTEPADKASAKPAKSKPSLKVIK